MLITPRSVLWGMVFLACCGIMYGSEVKISTPFLAYRGLCKRDAGLNLYEVMHFIGNADEAEVHIERSAQCGNIFSGN